jgi:arylsulfatase
MRKPNILLLLTDQHRWDALGCSGGWVASPNLDRIAAEGVVFSNCVTAAPVCVPARLSLAVGRYPHNLGVWSNRRVTLAPTAPTWMRGLRDSGYRTSLFGKTHLHPHDGGDLRDREHLLHAYGFDDVDEVPGPHAASRITCHMTDEWQKRGLLHAFRCDMERRRNAAFPIVRPSPLGLDDYYDTYVGRAAVSYLRAYDSPKPWFCWVGFPGPHEPWDVPEPYASMYVAADMPEPIPYPSHWYRGHQSRALGWLDQRLTRQGPLITTSLAKKLRANYAGSISLIDRLIGEIIAALLTRGMFDHTVVIFTSDHGEMAGDFGLLMKSVMLDGAVRIPLLIRTPATARKARGMRVVPYPVELIDIGPTLVELAGGFSPQQQFGRSLVPVLERREAAHRSEAIIEHRREITLFNHRWKMTLNASGKPYLLFDRREDPYEWKNLAGRKAYTSLERALIDQIAVRFDGACLGDSAPVLVN